MYVNIIDDTDGTTVYRLLNPITVKPNNVLIERLVELILYNDTSSPLLLELNSGNINLVSKNVIALATGFNIQSSSSSSLNSNSSRNSSSAIYQMNNQMAVLREILVRKVVDLSVSNISSMKVISSALSVATQAVEQVSSDLAVIY